MESRKETRTTFLKPQQKRTVETYLLDAEGKTLGRLCSEVSKILRGKHKVNYTPYVHFGDRVVIINANKVKVTGMKRARKIYRYYTGHIGGMREISFENMMDRKPEYIIHHAVKGMVPRNCLGRRQMKGLRIVSDQKEILEKKDLIKIEI